MTVKDGAMLNAEWIRRYDLVDPDRMQISPDDKQFLGIYNFTIPELDRATDHVEEMVQALSTLIGEIPSMLVQPPQPEGSFQTWVEGRRQPNAAGALHLSQCRVRLL